ncbi:Crp/Fnr family transcriptional regulator [Mucilaginibacter sp. BT774]|uniref:Crp/Fnr family transcriptional regulator n=1 Tax=Mucilaginibacter sp. BT774 TaxID=3062276 RepID=UPI0026760313|nr:Crp/Fnr family transcriptional regulator [Mucilaginibacter sp. BT774]MDO3628560.1 Crp/Fnr family transcriptional regulator [Mucilaginibacter sp. BT774]
MTTAIFSDPNLLAELKKFARTKHLKQGEVLIVPGDKIFFVPIVQRGVLRIVRQGEDGREVFLYHLYPGQTCAMAMNCCQSHKESMIKAVAEDDTEVLQIPVNMLEDWFKYPEWKAFVNNTYGNRFAELMDVIDLIAFHNMDKQVQHYLQERARATNSKTIQVTHQEIADELHTHREAVSRLLRNMEQKKMLRLGRNSIELLNF